MVELPFLNYHSAVIIDKVRNNQPVTTDDIEKVIYGSALYRIVKPYFRSSGKEYVYNRGQFFPTYGNATPETYRGFREYQRNIHEQNVFRMRKRGFESGLYSQSFKRSRRFSRKRYGFTVRPRRRYRYY